jgi:dipeptidyl-peptidase-4
LTKLLYVKCVLFFVLVLPAFPQKKPVTLESLYDSPGRGDVPGAAVWAPDGKAFVYRQGGALKLYDPATKAARDVIAGSQMNALENAAVKPPKDDRFDWENRRVREQPIQWEPSGRELLYVTGGDLFLIHIDDGRWEQLTKTPVAERDPKLSPNGTMVAFRRGWDLYALDIAAGKETRLTTGGTETLRNGAVDWVYPEELSLGTAFWWSPDSKLIAYLQFDTSRERVYPHEDLLGTRAVFEPQRYPQAGENNPDVRLGLVAASGGPTRWLEIGDTRNSYLIPHAGWMPDSKNVYVVRTNRVQNRLELRSIGIESAMASTILTESDPYWINAPGEPRFLEDGKRFLWSSERDGFRHLYLCSIDGKETRQLTKGSWEVTALNAVDEAQGRVFYQSSEPSPVERHFYSVRLDGSQKKRLTAGAGAHTISMGQGGNYYLDTYSSLMSPPSTTLHSGDGAELGLYREADRSRMEEYEILPTEIVKFKGPDGASFYGRLIKPVGFDPSKKYPAIVTVYGGPEAQAVRNSWSGLTIDQVYAHKGYVVWQMDNRGSAGYGHAFERAVYRNLGVTELADQKDGIEHLVSMGFVDAQRVGVTGWSYGGFMTLNMLLNAPDVFRAGIAGAPVTSWLNYDTIYTERYMGLPSENADGYRNTALPQRAANLKAKLMIVHNFEDDNVLFQNTLQMVNALQQEGKQFEFMLYPQKAHSVTGVAARQMNAAMLDFFDRNLK